MAVLHPIERRIVEALRGSGAVDEGEVARLAGVSADQARRGVEWLVQKKLIDAKRTWESSAELCPRGADALERGLPERRLLDLVSSGTAGMSELREKLGAEFGPAMGAARRAGWVEPDGEVLRARGGPEKLPYEELLERIGRGEGARGEGMELLESRGLARERRSARRTVALSAAARSLGRVQEGMDVEADAPPAYPARRHPLSEAMAELREALVSMGFSEIRGPLVQQSFWNFDALYTPQDHPAREMQDTFFLDGEPGGRLDASARQVRRVGEAHRRGWRYEWKKSKAREAVLRTHTTCVTARHLDESEGDARVFSMGRVFRNEKASRKHLSEFHQVEGVMRAPGLGLRDLVGMQTELYRRLGLGEVAFWPTFFPYTEPSLQAMVRGPRGKWVEMFGMGVLRGEVLGSGGGVLAWGGGVERIAMLKGGVEDVRAFYENDLGWLRCR